jgi:class 3 adenylate cyclase
MSMRSLISGESKSRSFPFSAVGSLLLSDISGFTVGTSKISPLELTEVMGRVLELERRCIQESDGFMPYSGVAEVMLATWSSPSHATVALETGRRILAESKRVRTESGFSFQVRVGVTTGKMTVDIVGGRPQVYGAPFTTAQRLLALTAPRRSQLLCTSETLELVPHRPPLDSIASVQGWSGQDVRVFEFT